MTSRTWSKDEAGHAALIFAVVGVVVILMIGAIGLFLQEIAGDEIKFAGTAPVVEWQQQTANRELRIISVDRGADWSNVHVEGCTAPLEGAMLPGQRLTNCHGLVRVTWTPTSAVLHTTNFP